MVGERGGWFVRVGGWSGVFGGRRWLSLGGGFMCEWG